MTKSKKYCIDQIKLMIRRSKTKIIFPIITYGLLTDYQKQGKVDFEDGEIRNSYSIAVNFFKELLGHDIHIGGKYYDAYPSRNLPKYGVLSVIGNKRYKLTKDYIENSTDLIEAIPELVSTYINKKLGDIPFFENPNVRFEKSKDEKNFLELVESQININATNFEIFCFSILKIHLEKFACKIYRDTRTSAYDRGVDLSTNYGVIYQIKKLKLLNETSAKLVYNELETNFSSDRIQEGNIILVIDDISKDIKQYLINMKVQTITKSDLIKLARQLDYEDRMKVLKNVFNEFSREYKSDI